MFPAASGLGSGLTKRRLPGDTSRMPKARFFQRKAESQGSRALAPLPGPWTRSWRALRGHYATIAPYLVRRVLPVTHPPTARFSVEGRDPELGPLRLTGRLRALDGDELLVVVHGLGGSARSSYMPLALAAAAQAGVSCLLLNVRGADLSGEDFAHAGLTDDLESVLQSPALTDYRRVYLLGYSMGGHVALRYASEASNARLAGTAAVCSPLDLAATVEAFDRPCNIYRRYVLGGLSAIYEACYRRRGGPVTPEQARRIRKIRTWDERVVAPRFGFKDADDYYARASVGPRLGSLLGRSLYVGALADPMVPRATVEPALGLASAALEVHWERRGGHMGFDAHFDLGQAAPRGLEHQVLAWLRAA